MTMNDKNERQHPANDAELPGDLAVVVDWALRIVIVNHGFPS